MLLQIIFRVNQYNRSRNWSVLLHFDATFCRCCSGGLRYSLLGWVGCSCDFGVLEEAVVTGCADLMGGNRSGSVYFAVISAVLLEH